MARPTTKPQVSFDNPLFEEAYSYVLEAAEWFLTRWPHLQQRWTVEDLANIWMLDKFKFLDTHDSSRSSLRYYIWLSFKRHFSHLIFDSTIPVSLDAPIAADQQALAVDMVPGLVYGTTLETDSSYILEAIEDLADAYFDVGSGVSEVEHSEYGTLPKTLKSVAQLLLLGHNKAQIGEIFGVSKMCISRLARGPIAETLGLSPQYR